MYNYTEKDGKVLKGRSIYYYTEYLEKAQAAGYDSMFEYIGALYEKHCSPTVVADIVGANPRTILSWLKLMGHEIRHRGGDTQFYRGELAKGDEILGKKIIYYPKFLEKAQKAGYASLSDWICALRQQNKTIKQIGDLIGISMSSVHNWMSVINYHRQEEGFFRMAYVYAEEDRKVLKGRVICYYPEYLEKAQAAGYDSMFEYIGALYEKHCSATVVANIIGVSFQTILAWLKLMGHEIRHKGGNTRLYRGEFAKGDEALGKKIAFYGKFLEKAQKAGYASLVDWICALCQQNKSVKQIGNLVGISRASVYNWISVISHKQ